MWSGAEPVCPDCEYSAVIDAEPEAIWPWIVKIAQAHIRRAAAPNGEHVPRGAVHKVGIVTFEPPRVLVVRSTSTVAGRRRSHALERDPGAAGTLRPLDVVPGEEPPTDVR